MDIEKLIEKANHLGMELKRDGGEFEYSIGKKFLEYATALSTLQGENEKLREKIEDARLEGYAKGLGEMSEENEKLRAELESKEKYYEQMIDALSAADSADLAQMTACVYYKPGGLCRYGGDDPANVCVLGPCPHERTVEEVLADLARMTAERDAAVERLREWEKFDIYLLAHNFLIPEKWRGIQKED